MNQLSSVNLLKSLSLSAISCLILVSCSNKTLKEPVNYSNDTSGLVLEAADRASQETRTHLCKSLKPALTPVIFDNMNDQGKCFADAEKRNWLFVCRGELVEPIEGCGR